MTKKSTVSQARKRAPSRKGAARAKPKNTDEQPPEREASAEVFDEGELESERGIMRGED